MDKKKTFRLTPLLYLLFPVLIGLELFLYFFNSDIYFQLSGFYLFFAAAMLIGLVLIIKKKAKIPTNYTVVTTVIFAVYLLINSIANSGKIETGYLITYFLIVLLILELEIGRFSKKHKSFVYAGYIGGAVVIALLQIFLRTRFYQLESTRITIQVLSHDKIDPNYLAAFLIGPFFLSLYLLFKTKKAGKRILLAICSILIITGVVLSGSRGALVAIGCGFICVILFGLRKKLKFRYFLLIGIGLVAAVVAIFVFIPAETIERFIGSDYLSDGSNIRRLALWGNAFDTIKANPIFGYGARNTSLIIGGYMGDFEPAHNTFFDIWLQTGIFGILFFVFVFIRAFKTKSLLLKGLCVATVVSGMFIAAESCLFFWMNFIMCIYYSYGTKKRKVVKAETSKPIASETINLEPALATQKSSVILESPIALEENHE